MSLGALQQLASISDPRTALEAGASLTGNQSPYDLWRAIAEAQTEVAEQFVPQWKDQKTKIDERVSEIEQQVTQLTADWTGDASEAAAGYLTKVVQELDAVANLNGTVSDLLAAAIEVLVRAKRAGDDAERAFANALIGIVLGFIAAILAVIWIPVAGAAAAAALIGAGIAAVAALIAAFIAYLWQMKVNRDRMNEDLAKQMEKLKDLTPGEPPTVVPDVPTPSLDPVTIKTTIPEPPPVPALG